MTREEFVQNIIDRYEKGAATIRAKNADYANEDNPFNNFELVEHIGITDAKRAILVRVSDKIARIANLLDREGFVKDEAIDDSILDAINYLAILGARIDYERSIKQASGI